MSWVIYFLLAYSVGKGLLMLVGVQAGLIQSEHIQLSAWSLCSASHVTKYLSLREVDGIASFTVTIEGVTSRNELSQANQSFREAMALSSYSPDESLLPKGAGIDSDNDSSLTPFHNSIRYGDAYKTRSLLRTSPISTSLLENLIPRPRRGSHALRVSILRRL